MFGKIGLMGSSRARRGRRSELRAAVWIIDNAPETTASGSADDRRRREPGDLSAADGLLHSDSHVHTLTNL